jgi:signal transduction histidine kinase
MTFELVMDVREDDIDELGHVSNIVYLRWIQDVALAHSTAVGLDVEAYRAMGGVFFVRDNGRGIDPQDHGRVFELFRRGASAGDVDGVGIGLALSRRVVEAHGGELWLESEPGCGATFFFTLPPAA